MSQGRFRFGRRLAGLIIAASLLIPTGSASAAFPAGLSTHLLRASCPLSGIHWLGKNYAYGPEQSEGTTGACYQWVQIEDADRLYDYYAIDATITNKPGYLSYVCCTDAFFRVFTYSGSPSQWSATGSLAAHQYCSTFSIGLSGSVGPLSVGWSAKQDVCEGASMTTSDSGSQRQWNVTAWNEVNKLEFQYLIRVAQCTKPVVRVQLWLPQYKLTLSYNQYVPTKNFRNYWFATPPVTEWTRQDSSGVKCAVN